MSKGGYNKLLVKWQEAIKEIVSLRSQLADLQQRSGSEQIVPQYESQSSGTGTTWKDSAVFWGTFCAALGIVAGVIMAMNAIASPWWVRGLLFGSWLLFAAAIVQFFRHPSHKPRFPQLIRLVTAVIFMLLSGGGFSVLDLSYEHNQVLQNMPLCNRARTEIWWLQGQSEGFHQAVISAAKNAPFKHVDPNDLQRVLSEPDPQKGRDLLELTTGWHEIFELYAKNYEQETPRMEDLSDDMLARMGKSYPKLNVIEASRLNGMFLGSIGLDRTAKYFEEQSQELGCPKQL